MEQRLSIVTLGVHDIERSAAFYRALGWRRVEGPGDVVAFDLIGMTLGLYPLDRLAEVMGVWPEALGSGAMTLAHNVRERDEVNPLIARFKLAGGKILKPAQEAAWGGYHGYASDPDGHVWEIAWNPLAPLGRDGAFRWKGHGGDG